MRRRNRKSDNEETSYWSSYSDMMAALLLFFVLIISASMLFAKRHSEEQEGKLEEAWAKVEEQQGKINEQQGEIDEQAKEIEEIYGVKSSLIEGLVNEFSGTDLSVEVDEETGAITFDSNLMFDTDSYEIKAEGKKFLKKFLPKYLNVLLSDDYKDSVAEIIIEGHTDNDGTYFYNLELSQNRALSVAKYCLKKKNKVLNDTQISQLKKIITCNGKSFSDPITKPNGDIDKAASRRVEIKFRLKDDEMVEQMINILSDNGR